MEYFWLIAFYYHEYTPNHPYYDYFKDARNKEGIYVFDKEKVDKFRFQLLGLTNDYNWGDGTSYNEENNTFETTMEFGMDTYYDSYNFEYVGLNNNLLTYEFNLIDVDYYIGSKDDLGKYNMYYRVMKYLDNDEVFLRYVDIAEK